jgi:hypothetical protein
MLGIGIGKFFLLVVFILVIWYGFKYVNRVEEIRQGFRRAARAAAARAQARRAPPKIEAENMVKCPACGVYVTEAGASNCGRADCPW